MEKRYSHFNDVAPNRLTSTSTLIKTFSVVRLGRLFEIRSQSTIMPKFRFPGDNLSTGRQMEKFSVTCKDILFNLLVIISKYSQSTIAFEYMRPHAYHVQDLLSGGTALRAPPSNHERIG
ncbi:hypothetical protein EVAR_10081_1 [Eumeta japonica]|uniref:Uncharacterized protein n=1 Tax=Eumeta variegata TaxID=151549 RepID=A0A4C1TRH8_EUMVA|nr:hypothetical protein EVAR_10081_1 [Eumeta japonica]